MSRLPFIPVQSIDAPEDPVALGGFYEFDTVKWDIVQLDETYLFALAVKLTDTEAGRDVIVLQPEQLIEKLQKAVEAIKLVQEVKPLFLHTEG